MAEPKPDHWALAHMRWLALSRWDNEGGASPSRHIDGSTGSAGSELRDAMQTAAQGRHNIDGPSSLRSKTGAAEQ